MGSQSPGRIHPKPPELVQSLSAISEKKSRFHPQISGFSVLSPEMLGLNGFRMAIPGETACRATIFVPRENGLISPERHILAGMRHFAAMKLTTKQAARAAPIVLAVLAAAIWLRLWLDPPGWLEWWLP
jgi:transcriptional regulator of nitric oxide reductase